jgi:hypothetical protein
MGALLTVGAAAIGINLLQIAIMLLLSQPGDRVMVLRMIGRTIQKDFEGALKVFRGK